MKRIGLASLFLVFFLSQQVIASTRAFRVYSFKQLTSHVDRVFHQDGGAFADIFCREDAAEAMFVDSRVPELDGKVFRFPSLQDCESARAIIRKTYRKCATQLRLDSVALTAAVTASCR
jgi:hypothetical protein